MKYLYETDSNTSLICPNCETEQQVTIEDVREDSGSWQCDECNLSFTYHRKEFYNWETEGDDKDLLVDQSEEVS